MKKLSCLLFVLSLTTFPTLAAPATGEPIKIGNINAGGKLADFVLGYNNAAQMAVDEINEAGGVNGRPLQIVSRDAKFDPGTGVKLAEELLTREKVSVLMDCESSATTLAISTWAKQNKIPLINACSEADTIMWDHGNDYVFRTAQGGYMWMSSLLEEAVRLHGDKIKGKRWAIVAPNFEFGQSLVKMSKQLAQDRGLNAEWVVEQWPAFDKMEAGATVGAIEHAKPDIILNVLVTNDLVKLVREGNKRGLFKNRIVIAPFAAAPDQLDIFGKETPSGWLSTGFPVDQVQDEGYLKFKKAYEAKHPDKIKFYTITGYNAVQAIAAALRKTGSSDPQEIRDALETVSFATPFGEQHFRKIDHLANVPFWVGTMGIQDGKGALLNWHQENAADHSPTDAWIVEQRGKSSTKQ